MLPYLPKTGEVLVCNFDDGGFTPPEMVKRRPVVVVSRKDSHERKLCTVVPISATAPEVVKPWHHPLPHLRVPGYPDTEERWAKCDMLATVSFWRLTKPYRATFGHGRQYIGVFLHEDDLKAVRECIRHYLLLHL
jgi:uncharacterized protein YifN (PemK superfamily)